MGVDDSFNEKIAIMVINIYDPPVRQIFQEMINIYLPLQNYLFKGGLFFTVHSFMLITVFNEKAKKDFFKNN